MINGTDSGRLFYSNGVRIVKLLGSKIIYHLEFEFISKKNVKGKAVKVFQNFETQPDYPEIRVYHRA